MEEMKKVLRMRWEKMTFFGQYDLTIVEWGERDYGIMGHDAKSYSYLTANSALLHL